MTQDESRLSKSLPRFASAEEIAAATTQDPLELHRTQAHVFVASEQVADVGGIEKNTLSDWVRAGLLPMPEGTGGRGNRSRYPLFAVPLAQFVQQQRKMGFGIPDIRPQMPLAFGQEILELLAEPRESRSAARTKKKREGS